MLAFDHLLQERAARVLRDPQVQLHMMAVDGESQRRVVVRRQAAKEHIDLIGEPPHLDPLLRRGPLREEPRRLGLSASRNS